MAGQKNVLKFGVPSNPSKQSRKPPLRPYPLSIDKILAWADEHHDRTGKWPSVKAGRVQLEPSSTWQGGKRLFLSRFRIPMHRVR